MRKNIIAFLALALTFSLISCKEEAKPDLPKGIRMVIIEKKEDAGRYSYMLVKEYGKKDYWIATQLVDAKKGDTLYYSSSYENKNFESEGLKRKFKSLWFVEDVTTKKPQTEIGKNNPHPEVMTGRAEVDIPKAEGGVTIAEIFANPKKYSNQVVKIKGLVTKFNGNIMNRNWIHLQDGSEKDGHFDITVTSADKAAVGDTVLIQGKLVLNKDFGAGYKYEVVVEEAKVLEGASKEKATEGENIQM